MKFLFFTVILSFVFFTLLPQKNALSDALKYSENIDEKLKINNKPLEIKSKKDFIPKAMASESSNKAFLSLNLDTGDVYLEENIHKKVSIASLTKIMTAIVALDLASKDEYFEVSYKSAAEIPTKIGVVAGQKMTLNELLHALLLTSANDAAEVIREGIDKKYGNAVFIEAMNKKAAILGMKDTSFSNPQGYDNKNNFSSAHDLAILTYQAFEDPTITEIVKKDYMFIPKDHNHKQFDLYNWNGLLGVYPDVIGMKIGNTQNAGITSIVVSNRENVRIAAIVLGAADIFERDLEAGRLLDVGYRSLGISGFPIEEEMLSYKYRSWKYF